VLREELLLRPPGGVDAGRSRRRQEQNIPDLVDIDLELRPELTESGEVPQNGVVGDSRLRARLVKRRCQYQRNQHRQPKFSRSRGAHQLPGLRGMALVGKAGHDALIAVRHMLSTKLLPLPGAD
jgi:hypothetical protein